MTKVSTDKKLIAELLTRSIEKIYPTSAVLEKELLSGRRLRIYLGIEPTSPHLHLGHHFLAHIPHGEELAVPVA